MRSRFQHEVLQVQTVRDKAAEIPVAGDPGAACGDGGGVLGVGDSFSGRAHVAAQAAGVRPLAAL